MNKKKKYNVTKATVADRVYKKLMAQILLGMCINPVNTDSDRQELARFADWARGEHFIPLITVRYSCKVVGYAMAPSDVASYQNNRERQIARVRQLQQNLKRERAAVAAKKFFESIGSPIPDIVTEYSDRAKKRNDYHVTRPSTEDPSTGKW